MKDRYRASYTRVSTKEQALNSNALDQQNNQMKGFNCDVHYEDVESGTKSDRDAFKRLLSDVKSKKISELYIRDFSRIARNGKINRSILETLRNNDTKLFVLYSNRFIDLSDPDDWYEANQQGNLAERESAILSKRVKRGMEFRRKQHKAFGRAPFGYIQKDGKFKFDYSLVEQANQPVTKIDYLKEAIELLFKFKSYRKTIITLENKYGYSKAGLSDLIKKPTLRGHTGYKIDPSTRLCAEIIYNTHPEFKVLTEQQYETLIRLGKKNKFSGTNINNHKIFTGRIRCGICNRTYTSRYSSKKTKLKTYSYKDWICTGKKSKGSNFCNSRSVKESIIWNKVADELVIKSTEFLESLENNNNETVDPEILKLKEKIVKYKSINDDGFLNDKITELEDRLSLLLNSDKNDNSKLFLKSYLEDIDSVYFNWISEDKKIEILDTLVEKIIIDGDGRVNVSLTF